MLLYIKDINKIEQFQNIIYFSFQSLKKYYLKIKNHVYLCESIDFDSIQNIDEFHIILYNTQLQKIKEIGNKISKELLLIKEDDENYQRITLLF